MVYTNQSSQQEKRPDKFEVPIEIKVQKVGYAIPVPDSAATDFD